MHASSRSVQLQLGIAILLGYISIGLTFGVAGRTLGFSLLVLAAMSIFVFAGASQFLAIQLLIAGAGPLSIIAATFILNSRHIVMSLALRDRIEGDRIPKPFLAWGITDEVFASAAGRPGGIRDMSLFVALLVPGVIRFWRYGVVAGAAGGINWVLGLSGLPRGISLLVAICVAAATGSLLGAVCRDRRASHP
jgi:4-azaleucine resistance transporter AzlC